MALSIADADPSAATGLRLLPGGLLYHDVTLDALADELYEAYLELSGESALASTGRW